MNLSLVDNLVLPEQGKLELLDVHPHLGLLALAAAAESAGHTVGIYDPKRAVRSGALPYDAHLYTRAADAILATKPDVVGFTCLGASFLFSMNVAALIKRREPELPVLLGGPHATMLDRHILRHYPQFDVIVRHEADEILCKVLDNLPGRTFEHIAGISWRDAGGEFRMTPGKPIVSNLDALPQLCYDHYPIESLGLDLLRVEAGRGCPFQCTFCSTANFFQRSFRLKSPQRLVAELERLRTRYGVSDFKLDHDMFTVNKRKVREFCNAVRGLGFRWRVSARVDCVDATLLQQMAQAGCVGIYFGIETGSARMQKVTKKGLDLSLVLPTLHVARQLGIATTASFITGYPEESEEDQQATLDLYAECQQAGSLAQLHMLQPEPGTPLSDRLGKDIAYDGFSSPYNAYLLGAADREHVLGDPETFQTYYFYPAVLPRSQHTFVVQAVDLLRRVGPVLLAYTLRRFDGRLGRLTEAWREAARDAASPASLLAFIGATFGAEHHVTSLFRYAIEVDAARLAAPFGRTSEFRFDPLRSYRVNEHLKVLRRMRDCDGWLERIDRAAGGVDLLDDSIDSERTTYIVRPAPGKGVAYRIDEDFDAILELFARPRPCDDIVCLAGVPTAQVMAVIEPLVQSEILVPA